ncbi:DUF3871 family protein [uncultured Draconibacterium sp.]|uniref:DUF3871 family protein n=1 Tax=uncultured Draconibacterium sp. TaxID=1573823 RepID=UPI0032175140
MELTKVNSNPIVEDAVMLDEEISSDQFIHANTISVRNEQLRSGCIIPVFSKDNESTISHSEFIETTYRVAEKFFGNERILQPAVRVSHPIKGRIPEAMGKPAKELMEAEKTLYYERMAFVIELPGITESISGNNLSLTIGGVRAYNHENLYNRKSEEKFKVFVGFKNQVCTNLCIFTDGAYREIKARTLNELSFEIFNMLNEFEPSRQVNFLRNFGNYELTESQFAHLLGKARMYQHLPLKQRTELQAFPLSDTQVTTVAREYYQDETFCRNDNGSLDLWKLYNLFTGANKSSYIDTFLDRGANCFSFTKFLTEQINIGAESWYLNS